MDLKRQFDRVSRRPPRGLGGYSLADVTASEHEIRAITDAPGFSREDLDIGIRDGALIITGGRMAPDVTGSTAHRGSGRSSRTMQLRD